MSGRRSEVSFGDRRDREYGTRSSRYDDRYEDREIEFRRSRPPPEVIERDREEIRITEERVPAYVRNDPHRASTGPVVLRSREREEFEYAPRRRSPPREEETIIVRRDREESRPPPPPPPQEREREEIIIRREKDDDDTRSRRGGHDREREEIIIRRDESEPPPRPSGHNLRPRSRERERSSARHSRRGSDSEDEIIIRRDQREGRRGTRDQEEIIIRHHSRSSSPARSERPLDPQVINAPQIHQEVITHHRHIDHGYEVAIPTRRPVSRPPTPPSPPRERSSERVTIHRQGERNGRPYHDDLVIDRRDDSRGPPPPRDFYDHLPPMQSYAPPRNWPDGRGDRESEEIVWRRSNGPRRHGDEIDIYINHDEDRYGPPAPIRENRGDIGGRFGRAKDPTDGLWTEITKDLVVKEAIEEMGYEYEETDEFYYIIAYLKYEDIVHLTGLSEDIRKDRRERVKQMEWENRVAPEPEEPAKPRLEIEGPPPRSKSPWNSENERYIEREIVYRGGRPPPPPGWRR